MAKSNPRALPPAVPASVASREMQPAVEPAKFAAIYTNFVRVSGAPEDLLLDFGLNTDPTGNPQTPVKLSHRLAMSYYTAKRLVIALEACLARYEATFGIVDTDIARRIEAHAKQSAPREP